jgi:hypothetical protein
LVLRAVYAAQYDLMFKLRDETDGATGFLLYNDELSPRRTAAGSSVGSSTWSPPGRPTRRPPSASSSWPSR